jgi:hypothetical protein
MKTTALLLAALALSALSLGACDPYSPNLGPEPFRCQPPDPMRPNLQRCPDGYVPMDVMPPQTCLCEKKTADTPDGGGGPFQCNTDPNEPNESPSGGSSTLSTITPGGATTDVFQNVSICPSSDIDVYQLSAMAGKSIIARIMFDSSQGDLTIEILNSGGSVLTSGTMETNQSTATTVTSYTGAFYVRVKSTNGMDQNNYTLQLSVN